MSTLVIYWDIVYFWTLLIVFYIVMTYYIIDWDGISCLIILEYTPKTSRVKTTLLEPTKLLIALKNIWNAKLSSILRILVEIIE